MPAGRLLTGRGQQATKLGSVVLRSVQLVVEEANRVRRESAARSRPRSQRACNLLKLQVIGASMRGGTALAADR